MAHPAIEYLQRDHERLEALLEKAMAAESVERVAFDAFRRGLLRHIGIEEKLLFPAAKKALGEPLPDFPRLRADHGKLTALLVPSPTKERCTEMRAILVEHDAIEEGEEGTYVQALRAIPEDEASALVEKMQEFPEPPVRPHYDARLPKLLEET